MSSKTFFKRIALTAVASLGFGMLSVVPSNATVTAHTLTIDAASDAIEVGDSATAVLTHSFVNLGSAQDSVTLRAIVTSSNAASAGSVWLSIRDSYTSNANDATAANSPRYLWGSPNAGVLNGVTQDTKTVSETWLTSNAFPSWSGGTSRESITVAHATADRSIGSSFELKLYGPAAGTYTVTVFTLTSTAGATAVSATPSVTWTVTVSEPTRTATAASTVTLRGGDKSATGNYWGGTEEATDSQTITDATASTTDVTPEFSLVVNQKSSTATNNARESYTVSVSGEAYVTAGSNAAGTAVTPSTRPVGSAGVKTLTMAHATAGTPSEVHIWSTGTAGTATITVTTFSGLVLGTKTVTFSDDVSSISVYASTFQKKIVRAGGYTSPVLFYIEAKDANGNRVLGVDPEIVSSNVAVITSGSCTDASSTTGLSDGLSACTVNSAIGSTSGQTATLTIRTLDPARAAGTTSYLTATYTVSLGGAVATEAISFDKATYSPGEAMVVKVTAKDASGNPVYDGASAPTLTANKSIGGTITLNSYVGGVATSEVVSATTGLVTNSKNLFAPAASGTFSVTGTGTDALGTIITASASVSDDGATAAANAASDAAAEAIDAANAATDAANLAAEAADAATVAAEEARDAADAATAAVEELATQVATLMAALKAQITTLANTVAKIAKKVKA